MCVAADFIVAVLIGTANRAVVACSSTNWKTCIDRALALLGEVRAIVEKMGGNKESSPTYVLPSFPPSDDQRLPPPYMTPPNRGLQVEALVSLERGAMVAWFATQGP
jgi:hypothetical protein